MKILFITEKFPYPLDSGGRIRTYHILQGLSQEHDVTLLTTIERPEQRQQIGALERVCAQVKVIQAPAETRIQLGIKLLKNLLSPTPIVVERHYLPEMAEAVRTTLSQAEPAFNVVHFDHLDAAVYLDCAPHNRPTVLDEHNIVTNQVKTSAAAEPNRLKRAYMQSQLRKTHRYEAHICSRMTRCLVCSDTDQAYLLKMAPDARVTPIPNGVDIAYFSATNVKTEETPQPGPAVIFVGTLDYGPGAGAVRYFCDEILPRIHQQRPDVRFLAVGQNPPAYLQTLAGRDARIIVTGRVDDIRPYVTQAEVFIVPLRSGSGTRLKILDAMAMEVPIVATSIGAEGLDVRSGEHLLLADTPTAFSAAVLQLLQDQALARRLREHGRQLVQQRYSWDVIWNDLLAAYRKLPA
jgi:polysaccharide biosynthesis protein PslH